MDSVMEKCSQVNFLLKWLFLKKNDMLDVFGGLFLLLITVVRLSFVQMFIVELFFVLYKI